MRIEDRIYWNQNSYGKALKIKRKYLIAGFIFLCIITPFTNWLIPFIKRIIISDLIIRYESPSLPVEILNSFIKVPGKIYKLVMVN